MNIVVCLSRDLTLFSNITYLADGGGLTHASLGLSEDAEFYYSFNFKGLKKEYRTSMKKRPREMKRYIVSVPDEAAEKLKSMIAEMEQQKEKYHYAKLGVSLRLMHLPNQTEDDDKMFCSQFVTGILKESGCIDVKKNPADCTPNDLLSELEASGQIVRVEEESELTNPAEDAIEKTKDKLGEGYEKVSEVLEGSGVDKKLDPLYGNMVVKLNVAEKATREAPEKFAKLTGGLLKQGADKLMELKEGAEGLLRGDYPKKPKPAKAKVKKAKSTKAEKKVSKKK